MQRRHFVQGGLAMGLSVPKAAPVRAADRFRVPPEEVPYEMTVMQWPVSALVHDDRNPGKIGGGIHCATHEVPAA